MTKKNRSLLHRYAWLMLALIPVLAAGIGYFLMVGILNQIPGMIDRSDDIALNAGMILGIVGYVLTALRIIVKS